jgi:TRAP-type uncharacterized transport system substrate-binding protein
VTTVPTPFVRGRKPLSASDPRLSRSYTLTFIGDWGGANLHKICCWLTEEFCRRAGPKSRTAIWSMADDDPVALVQNGVADLCLMTPSMLMPARLAGDGLYAGKAAPNLRALAAIPQNDCMVLAVAPEFGVASFAGARAKHPALRIATAPASNPIGYVGRLLLDAHGIGEQQRADWGISFIEDDHPFDSLDRVLRGEADAVLQEAIMTPGWVRLVEGGKAVPLAAEEDALEALARSYGFGTNRLPARYWSNLDAPLDALDFSDFLILVRDDMPDDVAHLLTWCAVEARSELERQYMSIPVNRSPVTYPFDPKKMVRTRIPLHPGASRYYREAGHLES